MVRIFLIGYMGTGKTTAGRELAKVLNLTFYDLDHYIEARFQKTISQIFEQEGEDKFREIESSMLKEVGEFENVVIATGGGTPCFFDNMEYMNQQGETVYLKASAQALTRRLISCKANKRPLIKDKSESELLTFVQENLDKRESYYDQAKITFETENLIDKSLVEEYVERLIPLLKLNH